MIDPRLFVCGGASLGSREALTEGRHVVHLNSTGLNPTVKIQFENVAKVFRQHLSPRLVDLLEIASYVYSADCGTRRGKEWADDDSTEPWGRDFSFLVSVRDWDFWSQPQIQHLLSQVLGFLADDKYAFTFVPMPENQRYQQEYLQFGEQDWPFCDPERVLMFSGGLDSLAGAVETAVGGDHLVLVSHRPVSTIDARQRKLSSELRKLFPKRIIHVPVWINKEGSLRRESTQRTRSFLYSALGTVVAAFVRARGVRFYENGIVSINLPLADEAIRARASRTTHPLTLYLLTLIHSAVTERKLVVDNPYLFTTKAEVVASLGDHKAAHLISYTCSCSHSMFQPKNQRHCGVCSQCIDRRFAMTAANLMPHDSQADYVSDVFVGPRKNPLDRAIAVDYTRHAIELDKQSEAEIAAKYNTEISRVVRYEANRSEAAHKLVAMHKRHGKAVTSVLVAKVAESAPKLVKETLDDSCLLRLLLGGKYLSQDGLTVGEGSSPGTGHAVVTSPASDSHSAALSRVEQRVQKILMKFDGLASKQGRKGKKQKLFKRDTVIFAAIGMGLTSMKYCYFLNKHGVRTKWSEAGPGTYPASYQLGDPWRKKVQDEKTRARESMAKYAESEIAEAINSYLPEEFDGIIGLPHSQDPRRASKTPKRQSSDKHSQFPDSHSS